MRSEADRLIALLQLKVHPEGGHYRETFRNGEGRGHSSAIHFLLKGGEVSWWHRVDAAEVWHFYRGAPLELSMVGQDGKVVRLVLGSEVESGQAPQLVVPPGAWQTARSLGDYTFVGCTVAPGFDYAHFELAPRDFAPD